MALFSTLFVTIVLSLMQPFLSPIAANEALIEKTCHTTPYYDLCLSTLHSDSSSGNADTKGLVKIILRKAEASAADTAAFIADHLKKNATEYKQAGPLCEDHYNSAKQSLQELLNDLQANQFDAARIKSSEARESAKTCGSDFGRIGLDYPSELAQREDILEKLCDIASAIISSSFVV
ncbi:hypothetical protein FEM48_Zijuj06G0197500 [Ziziphus jujuba var. spinosa]|uniref:Pectinesterase inhibitor domain-containing protein n=1 Tax=Ziziphus jujuba var. spinosa TaxID=714518 RepID=A0A978VB93_ZIZJJ|nr:cell wall / vacuolar inhibitor of fructosidase 2-like [Ziziphus jujuba var. spinosa]KAH7525178.1 hypothetical protein FEM48_Zijuj06G0197500 [Ziziphus jujuba var. spinosa]